MNEPIKNTISDHFVNFEEKNNNEIVHYLAEIKLLRKIIAMIPGNIYWKDKHGHFMGCNNNVARILGYTSPNEVLGKKNSELFDENLASLTDESDSSVLNNTTDTYIEEHGLTVNNEPAIYLSKKMRLVDEHGKTVGLLGVSFDITERKNMEQALKIAKEKAEEASSSKSEFIANLSHDVKTPLAGIIGIAEILSYRLKNEELNFAKMLLISSRQLLTFFDNCLETFKLENSDAILTKETFNLKNTINDIRDIFLPSTTHRHLDFQITYSDTLPDIINSCRTAIYRILLNLVSNAVKFTHKGKIAVTAKLHENKLQLIVEDTGIGIPATKQAAIFEQFTRLTPSFKGIYHGSGIGLYITQKFITAMHGTIEVISEIDQGSKFIVTLPLESSAAHHATTISHNQTKAQTTPATRINDSTPVLVAKQTTTPETALIKILLVEDNELVQHIQTSQLSTLGCKVEVAESGEQALDLFEPGKYDLIFMDIGLPDIQGDLTAKLIRKLEQPTEHRVPIIALTAHISENASSSHPACGINDTMQKPLSREQAQIIIEKYVKMKMPLKNSQHLESVKKMLII